MPLTTSRGRMRLPLRVRAKARSIPYYLLLLTATCLLLPVLVGCGGSSNNGGSSSNIPPTGTGPLISQPNNDTRSTLGTPAAWTVYYPTKALAQKDWTFLVYMNGANDLGAGSQSNGYGYDVLNTNQMEQIGSTGSVNVVLQWETGTSNTTSNPAWVGTRRYYIMKNPSDSTANINSPMISQNSTVDMGDWESLQDFVQWGVQAYPAKKYCLILWDHGAGWRAVRLGSGSKIATTRRAVSSRASGRAFSYNYQTGASIYTSEIPEAINISNTAAGKFDIVSFDCSLMQMIEIAYQMTVPGSSVSGSYTPPTYVQATEESPPGTGLPYNTILAHLTGNSSQDPITFASQICTDTLNDYGSGSNTTQSVIATAKLPALVSAVNTLGAALTSAQSQWGTKISAARTATEYYGVDEQGASYANEYKDLMDFTNKLTNSSNTSTYVNDAGVISACQAVQAAAVQTGGTGAIAFNQNGSGHPNSHGLSIYLPTPSQYQTDVIQQQNGDIGGGTQQYTNLSFVQTGAAPNWLNFLITGPP